MSGRDKDKGKAHVVDHGKPKKKKNGRIDVSSDPTRQWVRPTGITFRNIDERTGTPIPTATTPPPYPTPFPTIPPAPFPPILPASFPAATTSQPPSAPFSPILPASFPAATTSQPPIYSSPGFAMPGFTPPSTHSPNYNTTRSNVRQGFNTSVPSQSSTELMQDLMQTGNFLALLADQRPPQQQQQQQQNNQNEEVPYEEVPSGADQRRRQRRQIIEDWEYVDNLVVVTPTPETLEPSHGVSEHIRMAIQTFYPKDRRWAVYSDLTTDDRNDLFKYFSDFCRWEPHHHTLVERNFHRVAARRLSDLLYDERQELKKRKGNYLTQWIGEKSWELLLKYWNEDPHFKNRSKANKVNRASIVGGQLHAQGSVSTATYARDLIG
ncbi:neural Wiskott-Aldrich syndrome protein-like isoform X2 [Medicago truncatula]|uniref:neural Wiskott-Aldrich syndrome protein-like isoform X2 n=1 Tax=Medicago truncatula TaxID=3880 RepID=UPI001966D0DE|nr:neural Wiskott-Aldrich syndrome protein-like isoform X2 [Medicago truncatula]